ncbi:MAG: MotA/TolQ/ExbB proton channel family protein [Lachnospiraceae bacterium]|nr:MotA/TolQ/ExbB proton channel family protein [Lachnospiraceae bacterium]
MEILCEFLDRVTNPAIIAVAVFEFVLMWVSIWIMVSLRLRIWKLNRKEIMNSNTARKEAKGRVEKTIELKSNHNWDEFDQFLEDYQRQGCWYSAFSLTIQIFTLLGILGTVAGLYIAMKNGEDMYHGVELALSTTILGILFAVIYKIVDIIIVSTCINYIEDGISRYEKIYRVDSEDAEIVAALETFESPDGKKREAFF